MLSGLGASEANARAERPTNEALVVSSETGTGADTTLRFLIQRCAPDRAIAPLAILTDAYDAVVLDFAVSA